MRTLVRQLLDEMPDSAERSSDIAHSTDASTLIGTEILRVARMATALHLAENAQRIHRAALGRGDAGPTMRKSTA